MTDTINRFPVMCHTNGMFKYSLCGLHIAINTASHHCTGLQITRIIILEDEKCIKYDILSRINHSRSDTLVLVCAKRPHMFYFTSYLLK